MSAFSVISLGPSNVSSHRTAFPPMPWKGRAGRYQCTEGQTVFTETLVLEEGTWNILLKEDDLGFDIILPPKLFSFSQ